MPRIRHVSEINYTPSFRAEKVAGMFDVTVEDKLRREWDVDVPIDDRQWNIGLITGPSGSGKSTIAHQLFGDCVHASFVWSKSCLLDDFPVDAQVVEITETLSRVGFSSPPQWLLPYSALSTGQKFRAELARCLFEYDGAFVFDEFTSVVDRQVAQIGSHAFQKAIRKTGKKFVAVTCHYDVEPWLQPDWVLDMETGAFKWGCLRRPEIKLEICRVHHSAWDLFKDHHYLTANIHRSAACFVGIIEGRPVVFDAWLPFFGKLSHGKAMRGHRTVCLPDFQGLGLGNRLFSELARMWAGLGYRVFSGTSHPAEVRKRIESADWKLTRNASRTGRDVITMNGKTWEKHGATNRLTYGFEFVGQPMARADADLLRNG